MNTQEIIISLLGHKGQVMRASWHSHIPSLKEFKRYRITKFTIAYVVSGIEYANRREIREAIEQGERGQVQPLPWGTWLQYPYTIQHTNKAGEYKEYIRLYPLSELQLQHFNLSPKVEFMCNGNLISRETAIVYCGAKAQATDKPGCMTICTSNIDTIGNI